MKALQITDRFGPIHSLRFQPFSSFSTILFDPSGLSLRIPWAINDSRSVSFGVNHDSGPLINPGFAQCQDANRGDAMLANA
jgi:hypothetical protein